MTAGNAEAAWEMANRIFPTDYRKDEKASADAGYPIYYSTAEGVDAWISDLGTRLELNLPDGHSENIWIRPDYTSRLDEIAAKAEQVKNIIGLTHQDGVSKEQFTAVLYIVSDYLTDIIKLAEAK